MRTLLAVLAMTLPLAAQQPPNQDFAPPSPFTPDEATLKTIKSKTAELSKLLSANRDNVAWPDEDIYLKAAEYIVKHNEWYTKDSGKQTLAVLDAGIARAKAGRAMPWLKVRGKPVVRGYISRVDGSLQPYSVIYPVGYGSDDKNYLTEIVLHGRDATLTEVKFIAGKETAKENAKLDRIIVDIYGRGNNAYRWAGETDVLEVMKQVAASDPYGGKPQGLKLYRPIIRGFSMGGGGTWHLGLHHPFAFSEMQPGAGFSLTRGHIGKFPEALPDYQERPLRIYDAANYAENIFNIPCVAYSGDKDPQIRAARNIENALKNFNLPVKFEHIVAPGLEHKMPAEWKTKVDAKLAEFLPKEPRVSGKVHYVTYTVAYPDFGHGRVMTQEVPYERSVVDAEADAKSLTITTKNVSQLYVIRNDVFASAPSPASAISPSKALTIDGQSMPMTGNDFVKVNGKWQPCDAAKPALRKTPGCQGPIDDAFMDAFTISSATKLAWHEEINRCTDATRKEFVRVWDKYLRGDLTHASSKTGSVVYFGDPGSNRELAAILGDLPIEWTKDKLTVNGKTYEAKTHYPVMIYPKAGGSAGSRCYHVLNTGHTFGEADFKGTNVLLYPRLGEWAVMKLAPTKTDPHAVEVVDAGIFDSNWQFEKKK